MNDRFDSIDALLSDLLDAHPADGADPVGDDPRRAARAADLLLLDSLLHRLHHPADEAAADETRVRRAMDAVRGRPRRHAPGRRRRALHWARTTGLRWALAAGLLVAVCAIWFAPTGGSAARAVDQAINAADRDLDREYTVTIEYPSRDGSTRSRQAVLTMRGGNRFLLRATSRSGSMFLIGSNGEELWVVAGGELVQVHPRGAEIEPWLQVWDLSSSFFDVRSALVGLRDRYDLRTLQSGALVHVRGVRRDQSRNPDRIEAWIAPDGTVERLLFTWDRDEPSRRVPLRMRFDLASREPLPDAVYEHSSYHP